MPHPSQNEPPSAREPFEVLCERLYDATRVDDAWRWSELSAEEAEAVRAAVRDALDQHVGSFCADLLERSAADVLARPGRPYGERMGDAAALLLRDLAAALRGGPRS